MIHVGENEKKSGQKGVVLKEAIEIVTFKRN
jgi:hypothetical protein